MPLSERSLETLDDIAKVRGAVLEILSRKGYKIHQDSQTKIVAKHPTSAMYWDHEVEIELDSGPAHTSITLKIDHRFSTQYLDKLAQELTKNLPTIQKQVKPLTVPLSAEVNKAILWQNDEVLVNYADAREFIEDITKTLGARVGSKGFLVITSQRVLFACKLGFLAKDYTITYGINLEDIMSVSPSKFGFNDKLIILEKSGQRKHFIKPKINDLIPVISATISERRSQLEAKKDS
jgi:hypothetical protein